MCFAVETFQASRIIPGCEDPGGRGGFFAARLCGSWQKVARPFSLHSRVPVQHSGAAIVTGAVEHMKGEAMKKMILAAAAAATLVAASLVAPAPASARDGGAIAAGVLGGLAAGAIIGSAAASAPPPPPAYYGPGPAYVAGPPCYWRRERFWDGYGWRIRRIQVCP